MPAVILPRDHLKRIIRQRKKTGAYRWDEVWDGVYFVSPLPNNEHQGLSGDLYHVLCNALNDRAGVSVLPPVNVSDREENWQKNFRCPDVSVFLPGNPAQDRESHWLGGPDFAVEILSPGDRARLKLPFYAKVGVREVLLIDRRPWRLELHRRQGNDFDLVGTSTPNGSEPLASEVLGLTFRLIAGSPRPTIEIERGDGATWIA